MFIPPFGSLLESPEFGRIVDLDKTGWPGCLLWHGWLPALFGAERGSPWADDAVGIAKFQLDTALDSYVDDHSVPFEGFHLDGVNRDLAFAWSDGSLVLDKVSEVGVAGTGVYAHVSGEPWFRWRWDILICFFPCQMERARLRLYCSILGC